MSEERPKRKAPWREDEAGMRTLFIGLIVAFVLYGASFAVIPLFPGETGRWLSVALTLLSIVVLAAWFLAVRGGWRLFGGANRGSRRAQAKRRERREKRMRRP